MSQYRPNNLEPYLFPLIMQAINISVKYLARRRPRPVACLVHPWRSAAPSGGGRRSIITSDSSRGASRRHERKPVGGYVMCRASGRDSRPYELPARGCLATGDSLPAPHAVPRAKKTSVRIVRPRQMIWIAGSVRTFHWNYLFGQSVMMSEARLFWAR